MDLSPLLISLKISVTALFFTLMIGTFLAYRMYNYKGRFKIWFEIIINLPLVLPPVACGFLLLLLLGKNGIVGKLFDYMNIAIIFSWQAAVIAVVVITLPFMYRAVYSSLMQVDGELFDTARSLGASEKQVFFYVALPLCSQGITSGVMLSFMRSIGEFGATLMVAGNIPNKTQTIPSAIYFFASKGDFNTALKWVMITIALSVVFIFLTTKVSGHK